MCVLVLRVCLQLASQTACKDHKDKEEDVFTPLWVFHFLFDHLLLSYTHSSFYTLSSLLSPRFLPVTSSFCGLVCECAGAWVRILCKRRLTHLFIVALNGDERACVCVRVRSLAQNINWHSSTSYCVCLSVCVYVCSHSLPAASLGVCMSVLVEQGNIQKC